MDLLNSNTNNSNKQFQNKEKNIFDMRDKILLGIEIGLKRFNTNDQNSDPNTSTQQTTDVENVPSNLSSPRPLLSISLS